MNTWLCVALLCDIIMEMHCNISLGHSAKFSRYDFEELKEFFHVP